MGHAHATGKGAHHAACSACDFQRMQVFMQHQYALAQAHHEGAFYEAPVAGAYDMTQKEGRPVSSGEEDGFMIMRDSKTPQKPLKLTQQATDGDEEDQFCISSSLMPNLAYGAKNCSGSPRRIYSPRPRNAYSSISQINELAVSPNHKYSVHKAGMMLAQNSLGA
jgi:hypothetical protein